MAVVGIFNTYQDTVDLLRTLLEREGFLTFTADLDEIRRGDIDFIALLAQHPPDVIIVDIPPPYPSSWNFARLIRHLVPLQHVPAIVTTTNKPALEKIVGATETLELINKPYDFEEVVHAARRAYEGRRPT